MKQVYLSFNFDEMAEAVGTYSVVGYQNRETTGFINLFDELHFLPRLLVIGVALGSKRIRMN